MEKSACSSGKRFDFERDVSLVQHQGNSSYMIPGVSLMALEFQERSKHCFLCSVQRDNCGIRVLFTAFFRGIVSREILFTALCTGMTYW